MQELAALVEAAQAGNKEAYDVLIERFQQMAYAVAYRYLQDHQLAEDVVQEAEIEAFIHLLRLKEPEAFPGWFRQIVFRQCTRVLRQPTVQYTSLEAISSCWLAENNPEELVMQKEVQASVCSAVASLPRHERLVTVLFYGCHYSYNEVSTYLNIPLATVKKRLHSARQRLKVQLQAALHEASEQARGTSEEAEIVLVRWWHCLIHHILAMKETIQCMINLSRPLSYSPW